METMREFALDEIILDYDIYGRGEVNPTRVVALTEIYKERPETFEPIRLWVDGGVIKLCDGFARYLAAKTAGIPQVAGFIDETIQSAYEAKRASMQHNTRDKDGIPQGRIDDYIREAYHKGLTAREIQIDVNKTQKYIGDLLKPEREFDEWIRDLDILRLYLAGHTEAEIADELDDLNQSGVHRHLIHLFSEKQMNCILEEAREHYVTMRDDRLGSHLLNPWKPPPVNFSFDVLSGLDIVEQELDGVDPQMNVSTYWAFSSKIAQHYGTEGYPGRIPGPIVECLLHLYTKPFDNVYDPFAGGGTTLDVCKAYFRRSWGSDIAPLPIRREIHQHDIMSGAPDFFPKGYDMHFIMLDPPYWLQKKGEYSADLTNLANLPLPQFYEALDTVLTTCKGLLAPNGVMALIIGPTQNGQRYDHAAEMLTRLKMLGLTLINRLIVPYSTQQTQGYHITQMRETNRTADTNAKKRLCKRYRDILVMQAQTSAAPVSQGK
jgi:DNA modification methylase